MSKRIDFSNPLQSRKWLRLLQENSRSGIRIKPSLDLTNAILGFSFNSNELGLRGPNNVFSDTVFAGTSFAMGFSVNNGENWYDYMNESFFNIGLPVGPEEHLNIINEHYKGRYKKIIYLYHPNFWTISNQYNQLKGDYKDVFRKLNWKTSLFDCVNLYFKKKRQDKLKLQEGILQKIIFEKEEFLINSKYSFFDFNKEPEMTKKIIIQYKRLIEKFENVDIIRIPIKEEVAQTTNSKFKILKDNYDYGWEILINSCSNINGINFYQFSSFDLDDYLPYDTHWSKKGNQTFARLLKKKHDGKTIV